MAPQGRIRRSQGRFQLGIDQTVLAVDRGINPGNGNQGIDQGVDKGMALIDTCIAALASKGGVTNLALSLANVEAHDTVQGKKRKKPAFEVILDGIDALTAELVIFDICVQDVPLNMHHHREHDDDTATPPRATWQSRVLHKALSLRLRHVPWVSHTWLAGTCSVAGGLCLADKNPDRHRHWRLVQPNQPVAPVPLRPGGGPAVDPQYPTSASALHQRATSILVDYRCPGSQVQLPSATSGLPITHHPSPSTPNHWIHIHIHFHPPTTNQPPIAHRPSPIAHHQPYLITHFFRLTSSAGSLAQHHHLSSPKSPLLTIGHPSKTSNIPATRNYLHLPCPLNHLLSAAPPVTRRLSPAACPLGKKYPPVATFSSHTSKSKPPRHVLLIQVDHSKPTAEETNPRASTASIHLDIAVLRAVPMASDAQPFATDAPSVARPAPVSLTNTSVDDAVRLLKRPRSPEFEPASPRSLLDQPQHHIPLGSPTKSARLAFATTYSAAPLTGAAALEDQARRRRQEQEEEAQQHPPAISENPGHRVLASLMSGEVQAMSRPADAPQPAPTASMEPSAKLANAASLVQNNVGQIGERDEASPPSMSSVVGVTVTESPTPMDVDNKGDHSISSQQVVGQEERPQPGSLSYPGSLQSSGILPDPPTRGMSFPIHSQGQSPPTSSGAKKHKCPYCSTEFTRHHNLKSHLLTHSEEKPFVCLTCEMRFRRLHDLKRHGKLHTGEKPHICPKCERKFARGDALARHSKGAGGCAGRRSSMASFVDGDELDGSMADPDDSTMSGLTYDNGDEDDLRRQSLPSIAAQHVAGSQSDGYGPHRTYPPRGPATWHRWTIPSERNSLASSHTPNTSISSMPVGGGNAGLYSQAGMTESPKPLSPGVPGHDAPNIARQRSPSLSQQLQQQQFGRRQSELQSPHSTQPRPKLPGLTHPGFAAPSTTTGFSHARTGSGAQPAAGESGNNMFAQSDPSVWAYIQTMEDKVKSLTDKVMFLEHEIAGLKQQNETRDTSAKA
ncbi:hypothetical protein G7046_g8745 [Stylonectria norvegica]|nr:hypothetical protein G7046_g8745 [Stylonectria norvegica]